MILYKGRNLQSLKSSPVDVDAEISFPRADTSYEDLSDRFKCNERNFNRQYAHIYASRLNSMRDAVRRNCSTKWDDIPIRKLSELADLKNERCIIIGTLFKHQDLKPSILKELSEENQLVPQPKITNYVCSTDQLIIEDEIQRIHLIGNLDINKLVSGIVVGVLGIENEDGNFEVEDFAFGEVDIGIQKSIDSSSDTSYILMVSGLDVEGSANILALQLLIDWVNGELGCPADQDTQSKVCRVIIAGNSIKRAHSTASLTLFSTDTEENTDSLASIKVLDKLLLDLVKNVPVDIMPGEFDPSNHTLPQQPIHQCIFSKCSEYETLHRVTNPYECIVQGRRILGTAGQPINDIKSLTDFTDNLRILENTLLWRHLAPTAPDTIACYPYYQEDPFIITKQPDIYFAGNVSSFETKMTYLNDHPVRLVCLPVFAESQTCALLNLKTLECSPLNFRIFEGLE